MEVKSHKRALFSSMHLRDLPNLLLLLGTKPGLQLIDNIDKLPCDRHLMGT